MRHTASTSRRGFTLLLVMFVLTLVGVTLLTLGGHFTQTVRYAQSARMEAQAAQILLSGLAWAKSHHSEMSAANDTPPNLPDVKTLAGNADLATLSWARNVAKNEWRLTVTVERGRHHLTRSAIFSSPSPESKGTDSR